MPSRATGGPPCRSTSAPRGSASSAPTSPSPRRAGGGPSDAAEPGAGGRLTITVPDGEVETAATLVKAAPEWLSYRFAGISPAAAKRLAALVLAYHRRQLAPGTAR